MKPQYPLELAFDAAHLFVANVAPWVEQICIAGSIRRKLWGEEQQTVGDVEIVAIPKMREIGLPGLCVRRENMLWERVEAIYKPWVGVDKNGKEYIRWGEKYRKIAIPAPGDTDYLPCDVFLANKQNFGLILAIRTGPSAFSKMLVTPRRYGGLLPEGYVVRDGYLFLAYL